MRKEILIEIILGTIGGLLFALGMCMCLLSEWNLLKEGIVLAVAGFTIMLCLLPMLVKHNKISAGLLLSLATGTIGALLLGGGMSIVMTGTPEKNTFVAGLVMGAAGILICVLNYPVYSYIKAKRNEY